MLRRIFATVLVCIVATSVFGRVRPRRDAVVISVRHDKALNVAVTQNGVSTVITDRDLTGVEGQDEFSVNHNSDVQVVLENPNTLLYRYEIKAKEQQRTLSAKALDDFLPAIEKLAGALKGLAEEKGVTDRKAEIAQNRFFALDGGAESTLSDCDKAAVAVKMVVDTAEYVQARVKLIPRLIRQSYDSSPTVRRTVLQGSDWDISAKSDDFEEAAKALDQLSIPILRDAPSECAGRVSLAVTKANEIRAAIEKLEEFQAAVRDLGEPLKLDAFPVTRSEFTTFTIHVEKNEKNWPKDLDKTDFIGDRIVKVFPDERVPISLQASMLYSFVDAVEFGAEEIPAGGEETGFRITQKDKKTTGFDLAAGLEFAPEFLDFTTFNTVIQLAISPQDHLGIFLGFGIKPADKFAFGAGIAFHQVDELGSGQTAGGVLAKKDDLKVEKKFKSGPYLFFSYKPK